MTTTEEEPPTRAAHTQLTPTQLKPEPEPTTEEAETVTKMEEIEEKLKKKEMDVEEYFIVSPILQTQWNDIVLSNVIRDPNWHQLRTLFCKILVNSTFFRQNIIQD